MEGFFYFAYGSYEEVEIIDRICARYGWTVPAVMDLDLVTLYGLTRVAVEDRRRREAREQWVAMLPLMSAKILKYVSFEDYYGKISGKDFDLRPDSEILDEVAEIRRQLKEETDGSV